MKSRFSLHAYMKSLERHMVIAFSFLLSIHKAYIKPTWSLHDAYIFLVVYSKGARMKQRICKFFAFFKKRNSLENFVASSYGSKCLQAT